MTIKEVFSKTSRGDRQIWILLMASAIFFFVYAYFPLTSPARFVSPDETADYFFAKKFAQTSSLTYVEPLNNVVDGIIHPRNIGSHGETLLPEGFIGIMLLAGSLAKVFGLRIIMLITPLLAAITPLILYSILKRVFKVNLAFFASLSLFIVPSFWYYASRSMMNNLPFVAFLVLAVFFGMKLAERNRWIWALLFGLAMGLSLLMRTGEIFWITLIAIIAYFLARRKWTISRLALSVIVALICLTPFFIFNNRYFHNPLTSALSTNFVDAPVAQANASTIAKVGRLLFPFGIHLGIAAKNFANYGLIIFSWWSVFWLVGLCIEWRRCVREPQTEGRGGWNKNRRYYLILYSVATIWLILMYGSWPLQEYEDPNRLILGHSFLRYWLPITVFGMPYFIIGITSVSRIFTRRWLRNSVAGLIVLSFITLSFATVLGDPLYGLIKVKADEKDYQTINNKTVTQTENNVVIIAGAADKVFFPERSVISNYNPISPEYIKDLQLIAHRVPLYCYTAGLTDACGGLKNSYQYLPDFSANLTQVSVFDNGAILYRVNIE